MATSYYNAQLGNVDVSGNVSVIYPITKATLVKLDRLINNQTTVDGVIQSFGNLAFKNISDVIDTSTDDYATTSVTSSTTKAYNKAQLYSVIPSLDSGYCDPSTDSASSTGYAYFNYDAPTVAMTDKSTYYRLSCNNSKFPKQRGFILRFHYNSSDNPNWGELVYFPHGFPSVNNQAGNLISLDNFTNTMLDSYFGGYHLKSSTYTSTFPTLKFTYTAGDTPKFYLRFSTTDTRWSFKVSVYAYL